MEKINLRYGLQIHADRSFTAEGGGAGGGGIVENEVDDGHLTQTSHYGYVGQSSALFRSSLLCCPHLK